MRDEPETTAEAGDEPTDDNPIFDPGRYIERVSVASGAVVGPPPEPRELLVHDHRDSHPVDVHARYMVSRKVRSTGSERKALAKLGKMRDVAKRTADVAAKALRSDPDRMAKRLFGLEESDTYFRFKSPEIGSRAWAEIVLGLAQIAERRLQATRGDDGQHRIVLLLTGGTGFIGKEILFQAASDPEIAEVHALIRPKLRRDPDTGSTTVVASAEQRGASLLDELGIGDESRGKFHFLGGDIEQPNLGLEDAAVDRLARRVTHLVHCAASVAFDAPYDESFRSNVLGTLQALRLSQALFRAENSAFVAHCGVETSYIHGRRLLATAREDRLVFPSNFYNNYYELTKAMASIESERFMLDAALPIVQLCPSIVIGDYRTGNNRGDTKVVNAPVNLFGRAREAVLEARGSDRTKLADRSKVAMLARLASVFPSDPSAAINLITVDRVAEGVLAATRAPRAVGRRIHLANDRRITAREIADILSEELDVRVRLIEPTLHRNVGMPVMGRVLDGLGAGSVVKALGKMTDVFGGYAEWGQPIHEVGNDVRLLGLDPERPDPALAFRMLCRHNRWVQRFGRIKGRTKLATRERQWTAFLRALERQEGQPAATLPAAAFQSAVRLAGFADD